MGTGRLGNIMEQLHATVVKAFSADRSGKTISTPAGSVGIASSTKTKGINADIVVLGSVLKQE